jgi:hypothetical protein
MFRSHLSDGVPLDLESRPLLQGSRSRSHLSDGVPLDFQARPLPEVDGKPPVLEEEVFPDNASLQHILV